MVLNVLDIVIRLIELVGWLNLILVVLMLDCIWVSWFLVCFILIFSFVWMVFFIGECLISVRGCYVFELVEVFDLLMVLLVYFFIV